MTALAKFIEVNERFARSANLSRDADRIEPLQGYVVTARAQDVVERIARIAALQKSGGAWSLTGPYGSGKSSLCLLLDAAFGPISATRDYALKLIQSTSPGTVRQIRKSHLRHGTDKTGFHRGFITAQREPVHMTVFRAVHSAVLRSYGRIPPVKIFPAATALKRAIRNLDDISPNRTEFFPTLLLEIVRCLAKDRPLLLVIDEFGKNLESAKDASNADPYLLQQLAEAGQASGLPIFILTLQHRSFGDYFSSTMGSELQEWSKVQGRFEDIPYIESTSQSRALIGTVFDTKSQKLRDRIDDWAASIYTELRALGISEFSTPEEILACYPLHPLSALILPELCNRYGQHERTMFSFLTSTHPNSVATFLANTHLPRTRDLPSVGLDSIFDYFISHGTFSNVSNNQSGRWIEIATRLRDVHGLTEHQLKLAKTIAVLNLVSTSGIIRASKKILTISGFTSNQELKKLESNGVVIYRDYADEYRIWEGTDADINNLVDIAREQIAKQSLLDILRKIHEPAPMVAARHSAEHDTLRIFAKRYSDSSETIEPIDAFSPFDGEVLLIVGADKQLPKLKCFIKTNKPLVAAVPENLGLLDRAAREVTSIKTVLESVGLQNDRVAARELRERLAISQSTLDNAIHASFGTDSCQWILLDARDGKLLPSGRGSSPLSSAADKVYTSTPSIRNEMLNRTMLSSQGAKARRQVLEAMIVHESESELGLQGYGPEVAIYKSLLQQTGIHNRDARNDARIFRKPTTAMAQSLLPTWDTIENYFKLAKNLRLNLTDIYASLLSPPIGMKLGAIPIFLTAALLAFRDEVAIYEHGTFVPRLTPELLERMVKNPIHFEIKHFENTTGARRQAIDALVRRFALKPRFRKHRVANVLAVVNHLVVTIRCLSDYTMRTKHLSKQTISVRDATLHAVEPDTLIFNALPEAIQLPAISVETQTCQYTDIYAERISEALDELEKSYQSLLDELFEFILSTSGEKNRKSLIGQAASLENEVLNPSIRAFTLSLADDNCDTNNWIERIAMVVSAKAPESWTDGDVTQFKQDLKLNISAFQRLVALHIDHRVNNDGGFVPFRVTITKPDGDEIIQLASFDLETEQAGRELLDRTIEDLKKLTGSSNRAFSTLLGLLGDHLFSESLDAYDITPLSEQKMRDKIKHG